MDPDSWLLEAAFAGTETDSALISGNSFYQAYIAGYTNKIKLITHDIPASITGVGVILSAFHSDSCWSTNTNAGESLNGIPSEMQSI